MKKLIMIILFGILILPAFAQITYLTESQIDYEILHWYYDKYNHAESDEWYKTTVDGELFYGVKFTYEGQTIESIYDSSGSIVSEKKLLTESDIPKEIIEVLDYRIVKYKIKEYLTETTFKNKQPIEVSHMVDARTKTGGQVVMWFDKNFNVIANKTTGHLAHR